MHFLCANPAGNNLHRLLAGAVSADVDQVSSASSNHLVPAIQHLV